MYANQSPQQAMADTSAAVGWQGNGGAQDGKRKREEPPVPDSGGIHEANKMPKLGMKLTLPLKASAKEDAFFASAANESESEEHDTSDEEFQEAPAASATSVAAAAGNYVMPTLAANVQLQLMQQMQMQQMQMQPGAMQMQPMQMQQVRVRTLRE